MNTTMKIVDFVLTLIVTAMVAMSIIAGVMLFCWMGCLPLPIQQLVLQFIDLPSELSMAMIADAITFVVVAVAGWELSKIIE